MKVHFQRPEIDTIVREVHPDEVYYCGGLQLQEMLAAECVDNNIPLFVEDFDTPPAVLNNIKSFFVSLFCGNVKTGKKIA